MSSASLLTSSPSLPSPDFMTFPVHLLPLLLEVFRSTGERLFSSVRTQGRVVMPDAERGRHCFNIVQKRTPVFRYRLHGGAGDGDARVSGVPYSLVHMGGLSPSVPQKAWVSDVVLCLHDLYHGHNSSVLERAVTSVGQQGGGNAANAGDVKGGSGDRRLNVAPGPPVPLYIDLTMTASTYSQINDNVEAKAAEPYALRRMIHAAWHQVLGHGGFCQTDDTNNACGLHGHWSVNDLNTLDVNDVPMLICNKKACVGSTRPRSNTIAPTSTLKSLPAAQIHTRHASNQNIHHQSSAEDEKGKSLPTTEELLLSSGWSYKVSTDHDIPDESRRLFDWYKFLFEHFHLRWFQLEYKKNRAQRVQLFTVKKREHDASVIDTASLFLIVIAVVFNVALVTHCIWNSAFV